MAGDFRDTTEELLDRRLPEVGAAPEVLDAAELERDFGRRSVLHPEYHRRIRVAGEVLALTVTPVTDAELENEAPVDRLGDELGRLSAAQHLAVMHQISLGGQGSLLVDVVGPQGSASTEDEAAAQRFAQGLFDQDAVRRLM